MTPESSVLVVFGIPILALIGSMVVTAMRYQQKCADCSHARERHVDGGSCIFRTQDVFGYCKCMKFVTVATPKIEPQKEDKSLSNYSAAYQQHYNQLLALMTQTQAAGQIVQGSPPGSLYAQLGAYVPAEPKPLDVEKAEQTELIVAWRTWHVEKCGTRLLLKSVHTGTLWPWGEAMVAENFGDHSNGIYAGKTIIHAAHLVAGYKGTVFGKVALWGRVIEHEKGYRAQFAYPLHLYCENEETAAAIRRLYGCEASVG